jgi:hypothetical protein
MPCYRLLTVSMIPYGIRASKGTPIVAVVLESWMAVNIIS